MGFGRNGHRFGRKKKLFLTIDFSAVWLQSLFCVHTHLLFLTILNFLSRAFEQKYLSHRTANYPDILVQR